MIVGYVILLALAIGFLAVGAKGFSALGLPLTRKKKLTGRPAQVLGGACVLVGITILAGAGYDALVTYSPPTPLNRPNVIPIESPPPVAKGPPAERGHGLRDLPNDYISLFDGKTTFGWSGGEVRDGQLIAGTTTTRFYIFHPKIEVSKPGTVMFGDRPLAVEPKKRYGSYDGLGPFSLEDGVVLKSLALTGFITQPILNTWDVPYWKWIGAGEESKEQKLKLDLQTYRYGVPAGGAWEWSAQQYRNFILQFEVHMPKGSKGSVFVRAEKGIAGMGYEIPIYNQCENDDPARPVIASTGSIKNQQNARRLVSRDETHTSLTIIADGAHFATWVNGYQQTDWTDTRPAHQDPRQGLRTDAGTIQIMSFDPAAEMTIREMKVGELPNVRKFEPKDKK